MKYWIEQLRWLRRYRRRKQRIESLGTTAEVFDHYYQKNEWGSQESRSGEGSTARYTEQLRAQLPSLLQKHGVHSVLDAPCGDFNWFRLMDLPGLRYTGGDIVSDLVALNQKQHGSELRQFQVLDICRDPLPQADLWLCRDCLFHLGYRDIAAALLNFLDSNITWIATTTHYAYPFNFDIQTGGFRPLNLQIKPFRLPAPRETIEDWVDEALKGSPRRWVALWHREDLLPLRERLVKIHQGV